MRPGKAISVWTLVLALLAWHAAPAAAEEPAGTRSADLELVLAADASGSVDPDEWRLQLVGISEAFRDPLVMSAIQSGPKQRIAVALVVWADASRSKDASDWHMIDSPASATAFSETVAQFPRRVEGGTGIGSAIAEAVRMIQYNDIESSRQVIDVSGDGTETPAREDSTILLPAARNMAAAFGITVNGLAIVNEVHNLDRYYRANVIFGPGSFVMKAKNYVDFRTALRDKLVREIAATVAWRDDGGRRQLAAK